MKTDPSMQPQTVPGFSCVRMKNEIQEKIFEATKDMSLEERIDYFNRKADEVLRRFAGEASESTAVPLMMLAEPRTEYEVSK